MENMMLNEFVRSKRKMLGLSREEFARKAGVGLRFLRELEQGKETLKMNKVNQVLKLLGNEQGKSSVETAWDAAWRCANEQKRSD